MKRNTLLLRLCCLVLATIGILSVSDGRAKNLKDGVRIIIVQTPIDLPGAPRSTVPYEAEYNDVLNCVVLTCITPCGNVAVTLASTAGDWYQTVFDTLDGTILIPVSGDSGDYTLTLVASDGTTYVGEFFI